ncbi:MAG: putative metal-binding motif-containing protein, partial [Flavobacteriales bacterium]
DCNDADATIYPSAQEDCGNNFDNDCDGFADNVAGSCDAPGFNPNQGSHPSCIADVCQEDTLCCSQVWDAICTSIASATPSCAACLCGCYDNDLDGFTNCDGDCDDFNPLIFPNANEACNNADDNCNALIDEGLLYTEYFEDYDGDGYGTVSLGTFCVAPLNGALLSGDCDDSQWEVSPASEELCNELDDNCNNLVDDGLNETLYFMDADGDGYGSDSLGYFCFNPAASSEIGGDCDDNNAMVYPTNTEVCNDMDDDCSGSIDDGLNFQTYYLDNDADGFGDASASSLLCQLTPGYVTDSTDCNDSDANAYPGAGEQCNDADDNCNGVVDDNVIYSDYYEDMDSDDFGGAYIGYLCIIPPNSTKEPGDCNDNNPLIFPGHVETCNNQDDDCDGAIDEGIPVMAYYSDVDGDGYGDVLLGELCSALIPSQTSMEPGDCDDSNASISPAGLELCDNQDNECDGSVDEGLNFVWYYVDEDHDGFGTDTLGYFCVPPPNAAVVSGDCNDLIASIHPGVLDLCNSVDDDCDTAIDEDVNFVNYYVDDDGDGYGTDLIGTLCVQPPNSAANNVDCDDSDSGVYPNAPEFCNNTDDDCDGTIDDGLFTQEFFADADQDGFGGPSIGQWCYPPPNSATSTSDCNDND